LELYLLFNIIFMTSFAFQLTLIDTDVKVVESALKLLQQECDNQIKQGVTVPYFAQRISTKQLLKQIQFIESTFNKNKLL